MVQATGIVVNAVILSALYALVALGFTLIFGVGGVLNLAHGASITVGAFSAYYVSSMLAVPVWVALIVAALGAAAFSGLLYLVMIRHVEDDPIIVMILSLVTAVAVEQLILTLEGPQAVSIPSLLNGVTRFLGATVQYNLVAMFVISWLVIGGLFAFVNYTKAGKALLATSMTHKGAALVGIDSRRVTLGTWVLAGALAGLAGMFLGSYFGATFAMGRNPLILSFSIVVIGGIGSIRGSVIAAYLIGFVEVIVTSVIDQRLTGMASLVLLVIVLLVRPEGLYGRELTH